MIRKATAEDLPAVLSLAKSTHADMDHKEWLSLDSDKEFLDCIVSDGAIFLCFEEERLVGMLQACTEYYSRHMLGKFIGNDVVVVVGTCIVDKQFRGRGIMRELIAALHAAYGNQTYLSSVHTDNTYSLNNLKYFGYEIVTTGKVWNECERLIMRLDIFE